MQKKSVTKNYVYNLIYQMLSILLPLVTTPYISRVLGAEKIGIYSYTISISAYFILFGSLGIALYGQREIAYNQKSKKNYSIVFWEIALFRICTMLISMIIFYFCFIFTNSQYSFYYKILLIEMLANAIDISWFLMGLEEFRKTVVINSIVKIIGLAATFVFVKTTNDLVKYFYIYALSFLFSYISMWGYLPKLLVKIRIKDLSVIRHLKPTISLFVPQIAVQVYTLLDRTMIGTIIADKSEVGFYDQSQKIVKAVLAVTTSLGTVMLPRIASNFAEGKKDEILVYLNKSFNIVFILTFPIILGICVVSDKFVPLFFGSGYDKVVILMKIISPVILFIGISNIIGVQFLLPTHKQKEYTISVIMGACINFIINLILIPKYGAVGASIGTIIAELVVTMVQVLFVRKIFNFKSILKLSTNYIISSIIMFIYCLVINKLINNIIVSLLIQVCGGVIIYIICLVLFKDKFVLEVVNELKGRFVNEKI